MRVLLVHPDDSPERGPWSAGIWDRIVDLGKGGSQAYQRWSGRFQCPVAPLATVTAEDLRSIRSVLWAGMGRLVDREGLDWWELTTLFLHQQLEVLSQLRQFAIGLDGGDEVYVTRPGFHAAALGQVLGNRLHSYEGKFSEGSRGTRHYWRVVTTFTLRQLGEILCDKYDGTYAVRGLFTPKRKASPTPVVLLPSAYVNVSRTAVAYAASLPERDFLLVTTRSSARVAEPPSNVSTVPLASYTRREAPIHPEYRELLGMCPRLRNDLEQIPEISTLRRLGCFDSFPKQLRQGLAIRDAWRAVFEREPVEAVLCCDDSNPYTLIPLILGRNRSIPSLSAHHGAFDGRHLFKRNHADMILAKGKMEEDYLVRRCGLPSSTVEIGAPGPSPNVPQADRIVDPQQRRLIVLFSEAYEVSSGRAEDIYRDLLPALVDMARSTRRKLVIKLHPFESRRDREKLVKRILPAEQQQVVEVVSGPLTQDLLDQTWFGMTILSTVAMECALRGIPCFLAAWLENWPYGYIQQFNKFGVGYSLHSPREISAIPEIMRNYSMPAALASEVWQSISPSRFDELLSSRKPQEVAVAV